MAQILKSISACVMITLMVSLAEATPPGIANNPSHSTCSNGKYKYCKNLVHVCPKFCPNGCTTECVSCKPICIDGTSPPLTPSTPSPNTPSIPESPPMPSIPSPPTPSTPESPPSPPTPVSPTPSTPSPNTPSIPESPPTPSIPSPPTPSTPESPPSLPTPVSPIPSTPSPNTPSIPESPPTPSIPSPPTPSTPESPPSPPTPESPTSTPSPNTPSIPESSPTPSIPSPPTPSTPESPPSPPTPESPTPSTPSPSASGKKRARCKNKKYEQCYNVEHVCPSTCPGGCEVDCVSCKPVCKCDMPGAVCQDPRFIGGDGITFYFHGKKDKDFCLVSDSNVHINAHFIGKRSPNMTRDFTWVQSVGILFGSHKLFVGAQKTATWDNTVDHLAFALDGEPIFLPDKEGATWQSEAVPSVSITRTGHTNSAIVEVEGNFKITAKVVPITEEDSRVHNYGITKDDCFAHLDLGFKFYSLSDRVNGILGQTYGPDYVSRVNMGTSMPVMGGEAKFSSTTLFSTDCQVAQLNGGASSTRLETAMLSCSSGMDGEGVVCKR